MLDFRANIVIFVVMRKIILYLSLVAAATSLF